MKTYKIALLDGDGIGPELMVEAVKVMKLVAERNNVNFELTHTPFGASAWFSHGASFPDQTKAVCDAADAILKGPIGLSHEESKKIPVDQQPERGALLPLRRRYNTYANFRPVYLPKGLAHFSPLKAEVIGEGIDIMMIRELVGGLYFGKKETGINAQGKRYVAEVLEYDEDQIRAILKVAFETAQKRKKVLHNIHKSNVLKSSVLWNEVVEEVAKDYPEVKVIHILVDAAATYLCLNPGQFDVIVTDNLFGDILSDEIATKDVAQSLAYGVELMVADLRRRLPGVTSVVVQLDEPLITQIMRGAIKSASGSGRIRIPSQDEVISLVALFARDNELVMHSCAESVPIELIGRTAVNALSLDATLVGRAEYDLLAEMDDRGKSIWFGILGGVDGHLPPVSTTVTFVQNLARNIGLPRGSVALTHRCGLAGASPHYVQKSTKHLSEVSQELQERSE